MSCLYDQDRVFWRGREHYLTTPLQVELIARHIAWQAVFEKLDVEMRDEGLYGQLFTKRLRQAHLAADVLLSEAADFGCLIGKNAQANSRLPFSSGKALEGQWEGRCAIVVGAGPSLEPSIPLLRTVGDRAFLLAGGTAVSKLDFKPDFVGAVDRIKPVTDWPDVPLFTQLRAHPGSWSFHKERIVFPDSNLSWLNWILGEEKPFDGGWTVATFLAAVALWAGCRQVVFVGLDCCREDGQTQKDWQMAANWIQTHPLRHRLINTTPRGLIPQDASLEEVLSQSVGFERTPLALPKGQARFAEWCANEEVLKETLLEPLWAVWRPIFERDGGCLEMHKLLFFQRVLAEHRYV